MTIAYSWRRLIKNLLPTSEPLIKGVAIIDFFAHLVMMILHLTNHAYPGAPSERFARAITSITWFTPWQFFHLAVVLFYLFAAASESANHTKFAITLSWAVWAVWALLMAIWVVTAPVSWIPLVLGVVMALLTSLARKAWTQRES